MLIAGIAQAVAVLEENGLWGYVGMDGKWVVKPTWVSASNFQRGYAVVENESGLWGCIDLAGNVVLPFQYSFLGPEKERAASSGRTLAGAGSWAATVKSWFSSRQGASLEPYSRMAGPAFFPWAGNPPISPLRTKTNASAFSGFSPLMYGVSPAFYGVSNSMR